MERREYRCLMCAEIVHESQIAAHKKLHGSIEHYGTFWPLFCEPSNSRNLRSVPTYGSPLLAKKLGVRHVYVRDEGANFSGSMKDYLVERAVADGIRAGYSAFTVVSSGNHAVSLAKYCELHGARSIVFVPATSSKIPVLAALPGTLVIGIKDAIFEDAYECGAKLEIEGVYNANVSNDTLLFGLCTVASAIEHLKPLPTHILGGVGNGSYLAGIALGLGNLNGSLPKIVPVGMDGAFPTEKAFADGVPLCEYDAFHVEEHLIDAAEGSIAIASYSMPQLMCAVARSNGFPLGGLTNDDLARAYDALLEEKELIAQGAIPEPTGIMGLAAALKHKERFGKEDVIHISFTGHGVKDREGIERLMASDALPLIRHSERCRPDLLGSENVSEAQNVFFVEKGCSSAEASTIIDGWLAAERLRLGSSVRH